VKKLAGLCAFLLSVQLFALDRSDLTFYAPFENSLDARLARGKKSPILKSKVRFEPGVVGRGVVPAKEIRYSGSGNMTGEGVICFWAKPIDWEQGDGRNHHFFRISTATSGNSLFVLYYGMTRFWQFGAKQGGIDTYQTDFRKGVWRFIALSWRRERLDLYVNGVRLGYRVKDVQPLTINEKSFFSITTNFPTVIDELMVFKRALTLREIKALYYRVKRGPQAPAGPGEETLKENTVSQK